MHGNGNGSNGLYPIENKVCEKQETYRSELGKPLSEWMEDQVEDLIFRPDKLEYPKRVASDLMSFKPLLDELNAQMILMLMWLSSLHYTETVNGRIRVGSTLERLGMICGISEDMARKYMKEMLNGKLTCKFCGQTHDIIEVDDRYKKGEKGSSYTLHFIEHLKHIRIHLKELKVVKFNEFMKDHISGKKKKAKNSNVVGMKKEGVSEW